jgi:hypothetical protein
VAVELNRLILLQQQWKMKRQNCDDEVDVRVLVEDVQAVGG